MADPRTIKCACPAIDAADCIRIRYNRWNEPTDDYVEPERCECVCHDEWEAEVFDDQF